VTIVFRSRIDAKFKVLPFALAGVALFTLWTRPKMASTALWSVMELLMIGAAVLAIWITFTTYYELEHDALVAHSGPFSWRIPLAQITAVRPSNSLLSSPAMSMDRLEITYGSGRSILVSPLDKAGFLALLRRRVPRLGTDQR
jgi:hypothetical protein